jgi:diguanylate cyclase (GGDEF)-like protein
VLSQKRIFAPAFVFGTCEVVIHASLAVFFIGWDSGFHYFLIVLIPFVFFWPWWKAPSKITASICLFVLYTALFYFSQTTQILHNLQPWQYNLTTIINVFTAFVIFVAVAFYYQTSVNRVEMDLREANARLDKLSRTDPLTDLHNRRTIVEKIGSEEGRAEEGVSRFSIIMADIDHFKVFNDTYGHQFGDLVLISIAKILKGATRSGDIVARWGGEEFLVLLPDTGGEEAKEVADRMRAVISQTPMYLDNKEIHISMTFGVAECTSDIGINECIARADRALYDGKENGRNQVVLLKSFA